MENSYSPVHLVIMAHTGTIWNGHVPKDVAELNEGEKNMELQPGFQPGFQPGSSEFRSDALNN